MGYQVGIKGARRCWHSAQMKSYRAVTALPVVLTPFALGIDRPPHRHP